MVLSHFFCFDREKVVRHEKGGCRWPRNESCRCSQYLEIGLPMKENAHHSSTRRGRQSCPSQPWYAAALGQALGCSGGENTKMHALRTSRIEYDARRAVIITSIRGDVIMMAQKKRPFAFGSHARHQSPLLSAPHHSSACPATIPAPAASLSPRLAHSKIRASASIIPQQQQ